MTTGGTNIARVAQAATPTIPVIFATANDPVQDGLVKSINRPGDNSTGAYVFNTALLPKRFELLRQLSPNARLVGFLVNPNGASTADQIRYAQSAGPTMVPELVVPQMPRRRPKSMRPSAGLCSMALTDSAMGNDPFFQVRQEQVIGLAARHRIPTIDQWSEFVRAGGPAADPTDRAGDVSPDGGLRQPHSQRGKAGRPSGSFASRPSLNSLSTRRQLPGFSD